MKALREIAVSVLVVLMAAIVAMAVTGLLLLVFDSLRACS